MLEKKISNVKEFYKKHKSTMYQTFVAAWLIGWGVYFGYHIVKNHKASECCQQIQKCEIPDQTCGLVFETAYHKNSCDNPDNKRKDCVKHMVNSKGIDEYCACSYTEYSY